MRKATCTCAQAPQVMQACKRGGGCAGSGMRPIVNLGRASHVSLPAAPAHAPAPLPAGAARRRRPKRLRLSFRPVNFHLQNLHKVCALTPWSWDLACRDCYTFAHDLSTLHLSPWNPSRLAAELFLSKIQTQCSNTWLMLLWQRSACSTPMHA